MNSLSFSRSTSVLVLAAILATNFCGSRSASAAEDGDLEFFVYTATPTKPTANQMFGYPNGGGGVSVLFEAATGNSIYLRNLDAGAGHTFNYKWEFWLKYEVLNSGVVNTVDHDQSTNWPTFISKQLTARGTEGDTYAPSITSLSGSRNLLADDWSAWTEGTLYSTNSSDQQASSTVVFTVMEQNP